MFQDVIVFSVDNTPSSSFLVIVFVFSFLSQRRSSDATSDVAELCLLVQKFAACPFLPKKGIYDMVHSSDVSLAVAPVMFIENT